MTSEELRNLSIPQLVLLVLQSQETITQLQARVAELEKRSVVDIPKLASGATTRIPIAPTLPTLAKVVHHHHRHRRWYKRLWRALFPDPLRARQYLVIILIMIILAVLMGLYIAVTMMTSGGAV